MNPLSEIPSRITPEFASVLEFSHQWPQSSSWTHHIRIAEADSIKRISVCDQDTIEQCLLQGYPAIITDALHQMPATSTWTFRSLEATCTPHHVVYVNDRAPARHADSYPGNGGVQRTIPVTFGDYIRYIESYYPLTVDEFHKQKSTPSTPFYLNGWRAFVEFPQLFEDIDLLIFKKEQHIDNTMDILTAMDAKLFASHNKQPPHGATSSWYHRVDANLTKLFIGPAGTVTRLHYDAGEAHGWLAQIKGRKLFVLFPQQETEFLQPLSSEKETVQSAFDPLRHALRHHHDQQQQTGKKEQNDDDSNKRAIACIVHQGEALLIPQGWWHYAVALDASITLQRNFYHAASNGQGLVHLVKSFLSKSIRK